jgi:hypothetical protein
VTDFSRRMPSYEEGYSAFFAGTLDNPYLVTKFRGDHTPYWRRRNDHQFLNMREWQAGWNDGYANNLSLISVPVVA